MGKARWDGMSPLGQGLTAGAPVVLLLLVWMIARGRRRSAAAADAAATLAMVQPSDEYVEQAAAEAEAEAEAEPSQPAATSWHAGGRR